MPADDINYSALGKIRATLLPIAESIDFTKTA